MLPGLGGPSERIAQRYSLASGATTAESWLGGFEAAVIAGESVEYTADDIRVQHHGSDGGGGDGDGGTGVPFLLVGTSVARGLLGWRGACGLLVWEGSVYPRANIS